MLPSQGGEANKLNATMHIDDLKKQLRAKNEQTIKSLKEDKHSKELFQEILQELPEGRMTSPRSIDRKDFDRLLLARRFSVEQGMREDGSIKIRATDDETDSCLNLCTEGGDKIKCNGLDALVDAIHQYSFYNGGFKKLGLRKADIKSAYRRLPIKPDQRWMAWVILQINGVNMIARHNACMFGAIGSVLAWDRVGEMIKIVCLRLLKIPSFRWVDDYFSVEPEGTTEHTKNCFARCVRAMLGQDAIENKKLQHGNKLTILGIDVLSNSKEIVMWPTQQKVQQWTNELQKHEQSRRMTPGAASKMAGRPNFATQHCFKKMGRAMVRPFYAQQYSRKSCGKCDDALLGAIN